jgi:hypothetical protein
MLSHGVLRPNAGMSVCTFGLCFGREVLFAAETHGSGAAATDPPTKKICRPNAKPLEIDDV